MTKFAALFLVLTVVPLRAAEIPFRFERGLIWVDVQPQRPGRQLQFLLDSGATANVLDSATSRELSVKKGPPVQVAGVGSVVTGFWPSKFRATLAGVDLPRKYLVLDLTSLSRSCQARIDGLIGAEFFAGQTVEIDFQRQLIKTTDSREPADSSATVLPLKKGREGSLLARIEVNGRKDWVRLDTGFAGSLDWVNPAAASAADGRRISVGLATITTPTAKTTVRLGEIALSDILTGLHTRAIFPGEAGLLGNHLLSEFRVSIDLPHGQLALLPR